MAKVKIQGHASGTGVITVTAPNTSTDRTITLPDATDTLIGTATTDALTTRINAAGGRRNIIINGAMQVAQRGTTSTSEGYASVDRFFTYKENTDQLTITQATHDTVPDGFGASWKIDVGTAETAIEANDLYQIVTRLEGQDLQHLKFGTSSAQSITLQFWARSSKTGTYVVHLYNSDAGRDITATYTINTINTWEHKTMTFAGDTVSGFTNDANRSLDIQWQLMAGSNFTGTTSTSWGALADPRTANGQNTTWGESASDTFYITGVQLELGSTATDFEHRSYGEELALCQRYYHTAAYRLAIHTQTNAVLFNLDFPSTMRAIPSLSIFGSGNKSASTIYYEYAPWQNVGTATSSAVSSGNLHQSGGAIRVTSTYSNSPSVGKPVAIFLANRASANASYLILDSEL